MLGSTLGLCALRTRDARVALTSSCALRAWTTNATSHQTQGWIPAADMQTHVSVNGGMRDGDLVSCMTQYILRSPPRSQIMHVLHHHLILPVLPLIPLPHPDHFHTDLLCDYTLTASGHSALIAISLDGRGLYGQYETTGTAPTNLDACNGHTGIVPSTTTKADTTGATQTYTASTSTSVYHCGSNGSALN